MELWGHKIAALMVVFILSLLCLMLPIPLHKVLLRNNRYGVIIISSLMCFGGGTFLGVYMLHMGPDARKLVKHAILEPMDLNYPLAEVIIGLGFLMMLVVEISVMKCNRPKKLVDDNKPGYVHMDSKSSSSDREVDVIVNGKVSKSQSATNLNDNNMESGNISPQNRSFSSDVIFRPNLHGSHHILVMESVVRDDLLSDEPTLDEIHLEHDDLDLKSTRSMLLLMALSLHHIFEGISVGLKGTTTSVWTLVVAVLCHEIIISFSLGLQLVRAHRSRTRVIVLGTMCSLMIPVGVATGIGITESGDFVSTQSIDSVNGLLQSISTGVFLYVTFFEILHGEVNHKDATYLKLLFITLGYGLMCMMSLLPEDKEVNLAAMNSTLLMSNGHLEPQYLSAQP